MSRSRKPPADDKPDKTTDEDAALWTRVAGSVAPLKRRSATRRPDAAKKAEKTEPPAKVKPPSKREKIDADRLRAALDRPPPDDNLAAQTSGSNALGHGDAPGVDKRTAAKLRRGLLPVEATLDLHGHTQESARAALEGFVAAHQAAGRRCVLVITGKGLKGDDWSPGVLREAAPRWLNEAPLRRQILAFCHAQPKDGGSGALYILLKRLRGPA